MSMVFDRILNLFDVMKNYLNTTGTSKLFFNSLH